MRSPFHRRYSLEKIDEMCQGSIKGFRTINLRCLSLASSGVNCWAIIIFIYLSLLVTQFISYQIIVPWHQLWTTEILHCFLLHAHEGKFCEKIWNKLNTRALEDFHFRVYFISQCLIFSSILFFILKAIKRSMLHSGLHAVENFKTE